MKISGLLASGAFLLQTASAHYIFQTVNGGPAYQYFRTNTNYNSPVVDTSSPDMRCNVGAGTGGSTQTLTISAGSRITLGLDTAVYHNGPILFYLGRASGSAQSWDGSGANWFKFEQRGPSFSGGTVNWPMSISYDVTIPSGVPAGQWLLRAEQIGLHNPGGEPQFYIGCVQLQITGGGNCSPNYFSIPGHIRSNDPGITVNIYTNFNSYTFPGPAVSNCGGGGGGNQNPTTTARTTLITTTRGNQNPTTTRGNQNPTTTPNNGGGGGSGAPLYGQCGGNGWTGPTTCAQGTCKVLNPYYSQCT